MSYKFDYNKPIYLQLIEVFMIKIYTKQWKIDDKIPSVRDLANEYGVNPNTIQKALSILEEQGLLRSERTVGRFVCNNKEKFNEMREEYISEISNSYITEVRKIVDDFDEVIEILKRNWGK